MMHLLRYAYEARHLLTRPSPVSSLHFFEKHTLNQQTLNKMIITQLVGGLGNQMFEYAAALAVAKHNNLNVAEDVRLDILYLLDRSKRRHRFCYREFGLDIFKISAQVATNKEILQFCIPRMMNKFVYHMLSRIWKGRRIYSEETVSYLDIPGDAYMKGFWQRAEMLENIKEELRKEFQVKEELFTQDINEIKDQILSTPEATCVSFRRGDYVGHPTLGFLTTDYYYQAIEVLLQKKKNPSLFVFSDDIPWCIENFHPKGVTVSFVDQKYTGAKFQNYFHLMQCCKNFILPNSTYPYWAAYLASHPEKVVIAPRIWYKGQVEYRSSIWPADWITI